MPLRFFRWRGPCDGVDGPAIGACDPWGVRRGFKRRVSVVRSMRQCQRCNGGCMRPMGSPTGGARGVFGGGAYRQTQWALLHDLAIGITQWLQSQFKELAHAYEVLSAHACKYATLNAARASKPFVYMSISLPPEHVDVNIHPTKREVSLLNQEVIIQKIQSEVEQLLTDSNETRIFEEQAFL